MNTNRSITEEEIEIVKAGSDTLKIRGGVMTRCLNKNSTTYKQYGARGVTMCLGWRTDPISFLRDMGLRPSRLHSIERINNKFGYWCGHCPECTRNNQKPNCRWATDLEQANNRSTNRFLCHNGEKKTVAEWARSLSITSSTIFNRLSMGWSVKRSLTTPLLRPIRLRAVTEKGPEFTLGHEGQIKTVSEWVSISGLTASAVHSRIRRGKSLDAPLMPRNKIYKIGSDSKTLRQWAAETGIPYQTLYGRMSRGLTLFKATQLK